MGKSQGRAGNRVVSDLQDPFDLAFVSADRERNADYFAHALRLSGKRAAIIVDNVVREGCAAALNGNAQVHGVRRLFEMFTDELRVSATAVETVGMKGYDGFLMVVVL